jgi:hypothetical protein
MGLPPTGTDLLYRICLFSSKSSKEWDSNINAIIILDNEYRFKEDVEYGKCWKECGRRIYLLMTNNESILEWLDTMDLNFHPYYKVSVKLFMFRIICRF